VARTRLWSPYMRWRVRAADDFENGDSGLRERDGAMTGADIGLGDAGGARRPVCDSWRE